MLAILKNTADFFIGLEHEVKDFQYKRKSSNTRLNQ